MIYKIKNWWKRMKRALNWALFIFKQPGWQEYESFLAITEKRLLDMAKEFEYTDITESSKQDAKRMKLAAKLIRIYIDEKYQNEYYEFRTLIKAEVDITKHKEAYEKDYKALRIAFLIIHRNLPGWWQ